MFTGLWLTSADENSRVLSLESFANGERANAAEIGLAIGSAEEDAEETPLSISLVVKDSFTGTGTSLTRAFATSTGIKSVTFENSLALADATRVFSGCTSLVSATFTGCGNGSGNASVHPSLVWAFEGCVGLESFVMTNSYNADFSDMARAVSGATSLTTLTLKGVANGANASMASFAEGASVGVAATYTIGGVAEADRVGCGDSADMRRAFAGATGVRRADVINVGNGPDANMYQMMHGSCTEAAATLVVQNVANGLRAKATYAFAAMSYLTDVTVKNVGNNTEGIDNDNNNRTDLSYMFCASSTKAAATYVVGEAGADGVGNSPLINMQYAFSGLSYLQTLTMENVGNGQGTSRTNCTHMDHMLGGCSTEVDATWTIKNIGNGNYASMTYLSNTTNTRANGSTRLRSLTMDGFAKGDIVNAYGILIGAGSALTGGSATFEIKDFAGGASNTVSGSTTLYGDFSLLVQHTFNDSVNGKLIVANRQDGAKENYVMSSAFAWCHAYTMDLSGYDLKGAHSYTGNTFNGCDRITRVSHGTASRDGELVLKPGWGLNYGWNSYTFANCTALEEAILGDATSAPFAGGDAHHFFIDCVNLRRVELGKAAGAAHYGVASYFEGCANLEYADLTPMNTARKDSVGNWDSINTGESNIFKGCNKINSADGRGGPAAGGAQATIILGPSFQAIVNGFFWQQSAAGAAPDYVMASSTTVQVNGGPVDPVRLMQRPNVTIDGTHYELKCTIMLLGTSSLTNRTNVWIPRDYETLLSQDEATVESAIGTVGKEAYGSIVMGYGYVGDTTQQSGGTQVAWVIRKRTANGDGTLLIYPNPKSTFKASATNMARLRNFDNSSTANAYAPWGKVLLTATATYPAAIPANYSRDGDGYTKSFTKAKVYPNVVAGTSLAYMFEGCVTMDTCDLTNLTVPSTTTNTKRMFANCQALAGVYTGTYNSAGTTYTACTPSAGDSFAGTTNTGDTIKNVGLRLCAATSTKPSTPANANANYRWNTWQTVDARFMFAGCNTMKTVVLKDIFNGDSSNFGAMFGGMHPNENYTDSYYWYTDFRYKSNESLESVTLDNFGNGASAVWRSMFCRSFSTPVRTIETYMTIRNSGNGSSADHYCFAWRADYIKNVRLENFAMNSSYAAYLFGSAYSLRNVYAKNVTCNTGIDQTHMFEACGYTGNSIAYIPPNSTGEFYLENVTTNSSVTQTFMTNAMNNTTVTSAKLTWVGDSADKPRAVSGTHTSSYNMLSNTGFSYMDMRGMPKFGAGPQQNTQNDDYCFAYMKRIKHVTQNTSHLNQDGYCIFGPWDYSDGTTRHDFAYFFYNCPELETFEFTNWKWRWNPSHTNLTSFLASCPKLKTISIKGTGIDLNCNIWFMDFSNNPSLEKAEFGDGAIFGCIDFRNTSGSTGSFGGCTNLEYLDISGWQGPNSASFARNFFKGCDKIVVAGSDGTQNSKSVNGATIIISAGFRIFPGFFWQQDSEGAFPTYMMGANTKIYVRSKGTTPGGPTQLDYLQACNPTLTSGITNYAGNSSQIILDNTTKNYKVTIAGTQRTLEYLWQMQGYFGGVPPTLSGSIGAGTSTSPNASQTGTVTWAINTTNRTLTITPATTNGLMKNFTSSNDIPWYGYTNFDTVVFSGKVYANSSLRYMFSNLSQLKYANLENLNLTNTTTIDEMFRGCTALGGAVSQSATSTGVRLPSSANWVTSNITSAQQTFYGCNKLTSVSLSGIGNSKAINCYWMFNGCTSLQSADLSNIGNYANSSFYEMFIGCSNLTSVTLGRPNAANNTNSAPIGNANNVDLNSMFSGCSALQNLSIIGLFNGNDLNARVMFNGCTSLNNVEIKNSFKGANAKCWQMFQNSFANNVRNSQNTKKIAIADSFNGQNANMRSMFYNCTFLTDVEMNNVGNTAGIMMGRIFEYCNRLTKVKLTNVARASGAEIYEMFYYSGITYDDPNNRSVEYIFTDFANNNSYATDMFRASLTASNIPDTSKLSWITSTKNASGQYTNRGTTQSMWCMFTPTGHVWNPELTHGGSQATGIMESAWSWPGSENLNGTNNVVTSENSYRNRMPNFDLSGMPSMGTSSTYLQSVRRMFQGLGAIKSVGTTSNCSLVLPPDFINSAVNVDAQYLFANCDALETASLANIFTKDNFDMMYMFQGCTSLKNFTYTSTVSQGKNVVLDYMFNGCRSLTKLDFVTTNYPLAPKTMNYMFLNCTNLGRVPDSLSDEAKKSYVGINFMGLSTGSLAPADPNDATKTLSPEWSSTSSEISGMANFFTGCDYLNGAGKEEVGYVRPTIQIGSSFTKVLNGFFAYKATPDVSPAYVIDANISVFGGPTTERYLMTSPADYNGTIYLRDDAAIDAIDIWTIRQYKDVVIGELGSRPVDEVYGYRVTGGYIGYEGTYNGRAYRETNTCWSIRRATFDGEVVNTLVIFPLNNKNGVMKDFVGSTISGGTVVRAPWTDFNSAGFNDDFTQVVVLGDIVAHGSLDAMFHGCTELTTIDLGQLNITNATTSAEYMFEGCTALETVTNVDVPLQTTIDGTKYYLESDDPDSARMDIYAGGKLPFSGVWLPATLAPAGVDFNAEGMFRGCTSLTEVVLDGFARAALSLYNFLQGAFASGGYLDLSNMAVTDLRGTNATLASNLYMIAAGTRLREIRLKNVGNARGAVLTTAFSGNGELETLTIENVGNGAAANMTSAFANNTALQTLSVTNIGNGTGGDYFNFYNVSSANNTQKAEEQGTPNLQSAFTNAGSTGTLANTTLENIGNGAGANLSSLFTGAHGGANGLDLVVTNVGNGTTATVNKFNINGVLTPTPVNVTLTNAFAGTVDMKSASMLDVATSANASANTMFANNTGIDAGMAITATRVGTGANVNMTSAFTRNTNIASVELTDVATGANVTATNLFFNNTFVTGEGMAEGAATLTLANVATNTTQVTYAFASNANMTSIDAENVGSAAGADMSYAFSGNAQLAQVEMQNVATNVNVSLQNAFANDGKLSKVTLASVGSGTSAQLQNMFLGASTTVASNEPVVYDLTDVGTGGAYMERMFYNAFTYGGAGDIGDWSIDPDSCIVYKASGIPSDMLSAQYMFASDTQSYMPIYDLRDLPNLSATQSDNSLGRMFVNVGAVREVHAVSGKAGKESSGSDDSEGDSSGDHESSSPEPVPGGQVPVPEVQGAKAATSISEGTLALPEGWNVATVTSFQSMFASMANLEYVTLTDFGVGHASFRSMFADDAHLREVTFASTPSANLLSASATSLREMFANCERLYMVDLTGISTRELEGTNSGQAAGATNMRDMFVGCEMLTVTDADGEAKNNARAAQWRRLAETDWFAPAGSSYADMIHAAEGTIKVSVTQNGATTEVDATTPAGIYDGYMVDSEGKTAVTETRTTVDGVTTSTYSVSGNPATTLPRVVVGDQFQKMLNGFFWQRDTGTYVEATPGISASAQPKDIGTPTDVKYLLNADTLVYGGPQNSSNLMYMPGTTWRNIPWTSDDENPYEKVITDAGGYTAYRFSAPVWMMDDAAYIANEEQVWADRFWLNTNQGGPVRVNGTIQTEAADYIAGGYIGYTGTLDGTYYDGTSVSWAIEQIDEDTELGNDLTQLRIYSTLPEGSTQKPIMRDLGSSATTFAPWIRAVSTTYAPMIERVVIERSASGDPIYAHGSLENMFYGLDNLVYADLTNLVVNPTGSEPTWIKNSCETANVYQMFAECASVERVASANTTLAATIQDEFARADAGAGARKLVNGVILPDGMSDITNANLAFAGLPRLTTVELQDFANADNARLERVFEGSFAPTEVESPQDDGTTLTHTVANDATLVMSHVGCGEKASFVNFASDAPLLVATTLTDVATGPDSDMTSAFEGDGALVDVAWTRVGSGHAANMTRALSGIATDGLIRASATTEGETHPSVHVTLDTVGSDGANLDHFIFGSFTTASTEDNFEEVSATVAGTDTKSTVATAHDVFAADSYVRWINSAATDVTAGATNLAYALAATDTDVEGVYSDVLSGTTRLGRYSAMPTLDMTGMPGVASTDAATPSLEGLFLGQAKVASVAQGDASVDGALTLPGNWNIEDATNRTRTFAEMWSSVNVSLQNVWSGSYDLTRTFENDSALTSVSLLTDGATTGDTSNIGTATRMNYLFAGCTKLASVDITGIGTSGVQGDVDTDGAAYTQMRHVFEGALAMTVPASAFTSDLQSSLGLASVPARTLTIGPAVTKVLNGMVWDRESATANPTYTIQANINVYGGPVTQDALMACPNYPGFGYSETVNLLDNAATEHRSAWIIRNYVNIAINGDPVDPGAGFEIVDSGFIGYAQSYYPGIGTPAAGEEPEGVTPVSDSGTSVGWSVRRVPLALATGTKAAGDLTDEERADTASYVDTLFVFPTNGEWGLMRDIGRASRDVMAPWIEESGRGIADAFTHVRFAPGVQAHGALEYLFYNCDRASYIDLRELAVGRDITSFYGAFEGMDSVYALGYATDLVDHYKQADSNVASVDQLRNVLILPEDADTTGTIQATRAFADMEYLEYANLHPTEVTLGEGDAATTEVRGWTFNNRSGANLSYLFADSFASARSASASELHLKGIATGSATDMTYLAKDAWGLRTLYLEDVASGISCDLSYAFSGCAGLRDIKLVRVAYGTDSILSHAFEGASSGGTYLGAGDDAYLADGTPDPKRTQTTLFADSETVKVDLYEVGYKVTSVTSATEFTTEGTGVRLASLFEGAFEWSGISSDSYVRFHRPLEDDGTEEMGTLIDAAKAAVGNSESDFANLQSEILVSVSIASADSMFRSAVSAGNPGRNFMSHFDLTGLPQVRATLGTTASVARMFEGCVRATSIGYNAGGSGLTADSIVLPVTFDSDGASTVTGAVSGGATWRSQTIADLSYMFYGCTALEKATLYDLVTNTQGESLFAMFAGCISLRDVAITTPNQTSAGTASAQIGEASDMRSMFEGCTSLYYADLSSVGTNLMATTYPEDDAREGYAGTTAMSDMFKGAAHFVKSADDPAPTYFDWSQGETAPAIPDTNPTKALATKAGQFQTTRPVVSIGVGFTHVLNGFVWQRSDALADPEYVLNAQITVKGGPITPTTLMKRPSLSGDDASSGNLPYTYTGYVDLANQDAVDMRGVWARREYINLKIQGTIYTQPDLGDIVDFGYVGFSGKYAKDGADYDGTSVQWMIRRETSGELTLLIQPTVGVSGVMRGFGTDETTLAPWNANASGYAKDITKILVSGDITCAGSLEYLFEGMESVYYADLSTLVITGPPADAPDQCVTSMRGMFEGMSSIQHVGDAPVEETLPGGQTRQNGIILPNWQTMDASGLQDASFLFADMASLRSIELRGLTGADGARFNNWFEGRTFETASGATVTLTDVATGDGANLTYMLANTSTLEEVTLARVGTGDDFRNETEGVDLSYMLANNPALKTATLTDVGSGQNAVLTSMFERVGCRLRADRLEDGSYAPTSTAAFSLTNVGIRRAAQLDRMFYASFTNEGAALSDASFIRFVTQDVPDVTDPTLESHRTNRIGTVREMFASDVVQAKEADGTLVTDANGVPVYEEHTLNHMPVIDVSGLGNLQTVNNVSSSVAYMFFGCTGIKTVGYGATDSVVLPTSWDISAASSASGMFAACTSLESVSILDLFTPIVVTEGDPSTSALNVSGMFAVCPSLTRVSLTSSATLSARTVDESNVAALRERISDSSDISDIRSASDMRWMFEWCTSLTDIDMTGVGTYRVPFAYTSDGMAIVTGPTAQVDEYGVLSGGMREMFKGAKSLTRQVEAVYDTEGSVSYYVEKGAEHTPANALYEGWKTGAELGSSDKLIDNIAKLGVDVPVTQISVGPAFEHILNGFVWDRSIADEAPGYVINSDIVVYGGPNRSSELMYCPNVSGYEYFGTVNVVDGAYFMEGSQVYEVSKDFTDKYIWGQRTQGGSGYDRQANGVVKINFRAATEIWKETVQGESTSTDLTVTPTVQSRSFRAAKYSEGTGGTSEGRTLLIPGAATSPAGIQTPSAYGYVANTPATQIAYANRHKAEGAADITYNASDYTYTWQSAASDKSGTYTYAENTVLWYTEDQFVQDASGKWTLKADATPYAFGDTTIEAPLDEATDSLGVVEINLYCVPTPITFTVKYVGVGLANSTVDTGWVIEYNSESDATHLLKNLRDKSVCDEVYEKNKVNYWREGYTFIGWSRTSVAFTDADITEADKASGITSKYELYKQGTTYLDPGAQVDSKYTFGTRLAGTQGSVVTIFAHWEKIPTVTFMINGSYTSGAGNFTDYGTVEEGKNPTPGIVSGVPTFRATDGTLVQTNADGSAYSGDAPFAGFEVTLPKVSAQAGRPDLGWCMNYECTSAWISWSVVDPSQFKDQAGSVLVPPTPPADTSDDAAMAEYNQALSAYTQAIRDAIRYSGTDPQYKLFVTSDASVYRRMAAARATIVYTGGEALGDSYTSEFEWSASTVSLAYNRYERGGYVFDRWIWTDSTGNPVTMTEENFNTYLAGSNSGLNQMVSRDSQGHIYFRDRAVLINATGSEYALMAAGLFAYDEAGMMSKMYLKATWTYTSYTVTLATNGGSIETAAGGNWSNRLVDTTGDGIADSVFWTNGTWWKNAAGNYVRRYSTTDVALAIPNAEQLGYNFSGWTGASGVTAVRDWAIPAGTWGNLTLSAKWSRLEYTISYYRNGGEFIDGYTAPTGYTIETAPIYIIGKRVEDGVEREYITRNGYRFIGWTSPYLGAGVYADEVTIAAGQTGNLTFTANWERIEYTITYDFEAGGGGDFAPGSIVYRTYNVESRSFDLPHPVMDGFTFAGWTGSNGDAWQTNVTIPKGTTGNLVFVPHWTSNGYNIEYLGVRDGTWPAGITQKTKYLSTDAAFTIPKLGDYEEGGFKWVFTGWSGTGITGSTTPMTVTVPKGSTGDRQYTANYMRDQMTVTFDANFPSASPETSVNAEGGVIPPYTLSGASTSNTVVMPGADIVSASRYKFLGFSGVRNAAATSTRIFEPGSTVTVSELTLAGAKADLTTGTYTLYAQWESARRAITYELFTTSASMSFTTVNAEGESVPYVTGEGVTVYNGGGTVVGDPAAGTEAEERYASYFAGEEKDLSNIRAVYGTDTYKYEFAGWYRDAALTDGPVTSISSSADGALKLYAKWVYAVKFDANLKDAPLVSRDGISGLVGGDVTFGAGTASERTVTQAIEVSWLPSAAQLAAAGIDTGTVEDEATGQARARTPEEFYAHLVASATPPARQSGNASAEGVLFAPGYTFAESYNSVFDGSGTSVSSVGASLIGGDMSRLTPNTDAVVTMYAIWSANPVTVTYVAAPSVTEGVQGAFKFDAKAEDADSAYSAMGELPANEYLVSDSYVASTSATFASSWSVQAASPKICLYKLDENNQIEIDTTTGQPIPTDTESGTSFLYWVALDASGEIYKVDGHALTFAAGATTSVVLPGAETGAVTLYAVWAQGVHATYLEPSGGTLVEGHATTYVGEEVPAASGEYQVALPIVMAPEDADADTTVPVAAYDYASIPFVREGFRFSGWTWRDESGASHKFEAADMVALSQKVGSDANDTATITTKDGETFTGVRGDDGRVRFTFHMGTPSRVYVSAMWQVITYRINFVATESYQPIDPETGKPAVKPVQTYARDDEGNIIYGEDGKPQMVDLQEPLLNEYGQPVYDEYGKQVMVTVTEPVSAERARVYRTEMSSFESNLDLSVPTQLADLYYRGKTLVGWGYSGDTGNVNFSPGSRVSLSDMIASIRQAGVYDSVYDASMFGKVSEDNPADAVMASLVGHPVVGMSDTGDMTINLLANWTTVMSGTVPAKIPFLLERSSAEAIPVNASVTSSTMGEVKIASVRTTHDLSGFQTLYGDDVPEIAITGSDAGSTTGSSDPSYVTITDRSVDTWVDGRTIYLAFSGDYVSPAAGVFTLAAGSPLSPTELPLTFGLELSNYLVNGTELILNEATQREVPIGEITFVLELTE